MKGKLGSNVPMQPTIQKIPSNTSNALEALNSVNATQFNALDSISRQAAIKEVSRDIPVKSWKDVARVVELMEIFADRINQLPPARPKPIKGRWIKKHRHYGGFRSYTGYDAMGEQHTITVDQRTEYDDLYCSECGARSADNFLNFCPNCGADMREVTE